MFSLFHLVIQWVDFEISEDKGTGNEYAKVSAFGRWKLRHLEVKSFW